jgi:chromosome segregation ATPase
MPFSPQDPYSSDTCTMTELGLVDLQTENKQLKSNLELVSEELRLLKEIQPPDIQKWQEKATELQAKIQELETTSVQKDDIISKLKSKLEEVITMYKKFKEHATKLKEQLTQVSENNEVLSKEKQELATKYQARTDEIQVLKEELVSHFERSSKSMHTSAETIELEKLIQQKQDQIRTLSIEMNDAKAKYENEITRLRQKLDETSKISDTIANVTAENEALQLTVNELRLQLQTALYTPTITELNNSAQVEQLIAANAVLEERTINAENQRDILRQKWEAKLKKLTKNLERFEASIVGQANQGAGPSCVSRGKCSTCTGRNPLTKSDRKKPSTSF